MRVSSIGNAFRSSVRNAAIVVGSEFVKVNSESFFDFEPSHQYMTAHTISAVPESTLYVFKNSPASISAFFSFICVVLLLVSLAHNLLCARRALMLALAFSGNTMSLNHNETEDFET